MKRFKSTLGVTLLEIMLVLAIAAMVIVMSVRYYQSAQTSSQVNSYISMVQAYTAAAESLAQGQSFASLTSTSVEALLPGCQSSGTACRNLPWGGTVSYGPVATGFTLGNSSSPANAVCTLISSKFTGMNKYIVGSTCSNITYDASK